MFKFCRIYFFILALISSSCSKKVAKQIAGVYEGYTYFQQYQSGSSTNTSETINGQFVVERSGKFVIIMGNKIHQDSLADGVHTFTNGDCSSYILIKEDTLDAYFCEYYNQFAHKFSGCYGVKISD